MKLKIIIPEQFQALIQATLEAFNGDCANLITTPATYKEGVLSFMMGDFPVFWLEYVDIVKKLTPDDKLALRNIKAHILESLRKLEYEQIENNSVAYNKIIKMMDEVV